MGQWLIHFDDKQYSADNPIQIKQWLSDGRIPDHAFIYHPSLGDWVKVTDLEENLDGTLKTPTPAPGPPPKAKKKQSSAGQLVGCLVLTFIVIIGGVIMLDSPSSNRSRPNRSSAKKKLKKRELAADPQQRIAAMLPASRRNGWMMCLPFCGTMINRAWEPIFTLGSA